MNYFVTGGTGFIGYNLIEELLRKRKQATIYVLVRKGSRKKLDRLKARLGRRAARIVPVTGDLTRPMLGISAAKRRELEGQVQHVFHLAAIYDLQAEAEDQLLVNVEGTRNAVRFAENIKAKRFHHVSSIAAAGLYPGIFREDMFEEAQHLDNPYFRTKHDSEGVVRRECGVPWRIYRPGIVVGHSE
ncbi:MAG TPA: SDR family oxidoreductase, partial [Xanthomonadales bacterium]|nr:SDR family oxidoreductase [Xanthomonadales bacterium]